MKHSHPHDATYKNILIAFVLNLSFAVFEAFGGALTGSIAILSDAVHDLGDALVIGVSYYMEKKSRKAAEQNDAYRSRKYSVLGAAITTGVLVIGSAAVIVSAIRRMLRPVEIHSGGMFWLAVFGAVMNGAAAYATRRGNSLNQRAVNLHMLEDVLGWLAVLLGSVILHFTGWNRIDPLLSIAISALILAEAMENAKEILLEIKAIRCMGEKENDDGENDM